MVPSGLRPRVWTLPPREMMPLVTPALRIAAMAYSEAQPLATAPKVISVPAGKETA